MDMNIEENYKELYKDFLNSKERYINAIKYYRLFLNEVGYSEKDISKIEKMI